MAVQAAEAGVLMQRRLFTVEEYFRMGEVGVFHPEERVELIGGEIYKVKHPGAQYSYVVSLLVEIFYDLLSERSCIRSRSSVLLGQYNAPEPDVCLIKLPRTLYRDRHPTGEESHLLVEVSDGLFDFDRQVKGPLYAKFLIPEYWIVNINERQVEVHRQPDGDQYRSVEVRHEGETVSPLAFPDIQLAVADIFG